MEQNESNNTKYFHRKKQFLRQFCLDGDDDDAVEMLESGAPQQLVIDVFASQYGFVDILQCTAVGCPRLVNW